MPVTPLDFPEFVITTDSEQRWQIYNAISSGATTGTLSKATIATRSNFSAATDTIIAAASTSRVTLAIYNVGPAVLYIGQGSTTVSTTDFTYLLNAGDTYIANPNEVGLEHRGIFAAAGSNAEVTIGA
jgi:hypothetical protein